ncbi:MAG TPA: hypothetical protein VNT26_18330, partial [Candidatus Sulfotelmatobacter sp.]|nr:hypothetical protein [Candidatus Sulfotelmatobacter sp.]
VVTNQADAPGAASLLPRIAIQTNLDTALRLQIPKGSGFFLLNTNAPDAGHQRIGILLEPP